MTKSMVLAEALQCARHCLKLVTPDFSGRGEKELLEFQGAGRVSNGRHWLWVSNIHIEGAWGL